MINPAAENQGTWITVKQLAALMGTYEKKAQRLALKMDHRYELGLGRGGKILKVRLESLDLTLQRKYFSQDSGISSAIAPAITNAIAPSSEILPATVLPSNIIKPDFTPAVKEEQPPDQYKQRTQRTLVPWQDGIARAKYDLVHIVSDLKRRAGHANKMKAARDFLSLYNQGLFLYREIFKLLGKVEYGKLSDWGTMLKKANDDYSVLAPAHGDKTRGGFGLTDIEQECFLRVLLQPNAPSIGSAIRAMRTFLQMQYGIISKKSDAVFRRFAEHYKKMNYHIWVLAREGEKALDDKVLPYMERDTSGLEVGDILVADGKTINFNVLNPWTGKPVRACLLVFYDWASRYPAGFELNLTENVQCISSALRRAIITLGKKPKWVLLDNGRAFTAEFFTSEVDLEQAGLRGLYARVGINTRFARAYNGKDKPVERFFETFQEWVERFISSYCGSSIQDKPAYMKRNEKFHKAMHSEFIPTIDQAVKMIEAGIAYYANQEHSGINKQKPIDVFNAGKGPGVDIRELDTLMMDVQIKTVYRNGVRLPSLGYYFNEALIGYRDQVVVRYDFRDVRSVMVYDRNGEFMCEAQRKEAIDPLLRGKHDMEAVKQNARIRQSAIRHTKAAVRALNGKGDPLPALDWDRAMETVPNLPEIIEAAQADVAEASIDQSTGQSEHPFFEYGWKKYDWLMGQETLTADEQEWVTEYRAGIIEPGEFQALYGHQAAQ